MLSALRYDAECSIVKPRTAVIKIWKRIAMVSARNTVSITLSTILKWKIRLKPATCTNTKSADMMFEARSVRTASGKRANTRDTNRYISMALIFNRG